jgi:hypothetical protein
MINNQGTSMISFVKGKTEISPDLPVEGFPVALLPQPTTIRFFSSFHFGLRLLITRPDIHLQYPGLIRFALPLIFTSPYRRLSLGQPASLETSYLVALSLWHAQSPDGKAWREDLSFSRLICSFSTFFRRPAILQDA